MRLPLVVLGVVLSSAILLADDHSVIFDEDLDFSSLKTFVVQAGRVGSQRPELNSPIVIKKTGDAVRLALVSKGLKEVQDGGDVVAEFNISTVEYGIGPFGRANPIGQRRGRDPKIAEADFTEATLVLDLKKGEPRVLIWRGVYHDTENTPAKLAEALPKDAAKLLTEYPPKKKK